MRDVSSYMMVSGWVVVGVSVSSFIHNSSESVEELHLWQRWAMCIGLCPASHTDHLDTPQVATFPWFFTLVICREKFVMRTIEGKMALERCLSQKLQKTMPYSNLNVHVLKVFMNCSTTHKTARVKMTPPLFTTEIKNFGTQAKLTRHILTAH